MPRPSPARRAPATRPRTVDPGTAAAFAMLRELVGSLDAQLMALAAERASWAAEADLAASLDAQARALREEKYELERALAGAA